MGATGFAAKHVHLKLQLFELELQFLKHYLEGIGVLGTDLSKETHLFKISTTEEPSYRVACGVIDALNK